MEVCVFYLEQNVKYRQKHKQWDPDQMKLAIRAIRGKEMGYLKASKLFSVPKSTIEDYVKQVNKKNKHYNNKNNKKTQHYKGNNEAPRDHLKSEETAQNMYERTPPKQNQIEPNISFKVTGTLKKIAIRAEDISPLPSCSGISQANKGRKPRQGSNWVITSNPYKDQLEESLSDQEELSEGNKKKTNHEKQKTGKFIVAVRDASSDSGNDPILDDNSDMDVDDEDEDPECTFCNGLYSEDTRWSYENFL